MVFSGIPPVFVPTLDIAARSLSQGAHQGALHPGTGEALLILRGTVREQPLRWASLFWPWSCLSPLSCLTGCCVGCCSGPKSLSGGLGLFARSFGGFGRVGRESEACFRVLPVEYSLELHGVGLSLLWRAPARWESQRCPPCIRGSHACVVFSARTRVVSGSQIVSTIIQCWYWHLGAAQGRRSRLGKFTVLAHNVE